MTSKELREVARTVISEQLRSEKFESERTLAALQVLHAPTDPDEEREANRIHYEAMNASAQALGLNMTKAEGLAGMQQALR